MSNPKSIGIKLYNDSFIPVLKSNEIKSKRLVLTTVRNNQKKAIIELYEGTSDKCINNEYLGKLVININRSTEKGEPAIEVHMRLDEDGILYAKAWDSETNEQSIIQIEHSQKKKILQETLADDEINRKSSKAKIISNYDSNRDNFVNILKIAIIICIILILLGLIVFGVWLVNKKYGNAIKDAFSKKMEKKIVEDNNKNKLEEKKEEITGIKDLNGEKYYIRWGDNLWDICKKFYNDPWYYPSLAEVNNIKNPRLIYAGTYMIIPPKSSLKRWELVDK